MRCFTPRLDAFQGNGETGIMRIAFTEIIGHEISRPITDDGWFPKQELELADGPEGIIHVGLSGSKQAIVKGDMRFGVISSCDRCCSPVRIEVEADFAYYCTVGEEQNGSHDVECHQEDYNKLYLKEPVIELNEIFTEQVFLAMPSRILCDDLCKGLCHVCGIDLNNEQCECDADNSTSPFSILSKLKIT